MIAEMMKLQVERKRTGWAAELT